MHPWDEPDNRTNTAQLHLHGGLGEAEFMETEGRGLACDSGSRVPV